MAHVYHVAYRVDADTAKGISMKTDLPNREVEGMNSELNIVVLLTGTKAYGCTCKSLPFRKQFPHLQELYGLQVFPYNRVDIPKQITECQV